MALMDEAIEQRGGELLVAKDLNPFCKGQIGGDDRCPPRLYDARHTFVTRLAENPKVSEETTRQLAGHVSPRMLARYAHIRAQDRRDAIATLERSAEAAPAADFTVDRAQKWAQSKDSAEPLPN
jgi:integrase